MQALTRRQVLGTCITAMAAGAATRVARAALAAPPAGFSEPAVEAIVRAAMAERKIPGVTLGVVHHGRTLLRAAYGKSHLELDAAARPEHLYGSGSTGKMFTATAILQLAAAGKLALTDPVSRHLPDTPPAWSDITLDQLLRHRSGIKDYDEVQDFRIALEWTQRQFIAAAAGWPLEFKPGTRFRYSNSGYVLLGFVVENAGGRPFADYMARQVFAPAGMKTARVDDSRAIIAGRAQGYAADAALNPMRPDPVSRSVNQFGDGSLLFNIDDLIAWEKAVAGHVLLTPEAQHSIEVAPPFPDGNSPLVNYGAGWATRFVRGHRLVSHSGVWNGFGAWIGRWPDDELAIMVCTNSERGYPAGWAPRIAGLIDPALAPYEPITDADPTRTKHDRARLAAYLAGGYAHDGSSAQQCAHAIERGPLADEEVVSLVAIENGRRVYSIGKDGYVDQLARIGAKGPIDLSGE